MLRRWGVFGEGEERGKRARDRHRDGVCRPSALGLANAPMSRGETKKRVASGVLGLSSNFLFYFKILKKKIKKRN